MTGEDAPEPAALLEEEGRYLEAGLAFARRGEHARALRNLERVPKGHPGYREACLTAVGLAAQAGIVSLPFENLLASFVREGPRDAEEAAAFSRLGELYERCGFFPNAAEVLEKLARVRTLDAEESSRLARVGAAPISYSMLPDLPPEPVPPPQPDREPVTALDDDDHGIAFQVGATIAGRYRLEERIGKGGTAVVFRAADLEVGDTIAMKVLTEAVFDRETDDRFRRELLLSRRIQHANVVRLYDVGLAHGFRYVTLELLKGQDLRCRMGSRALPVAEALGYLVQACRGLQAAHDMGIVHRDVKPENCFLVRDGDLKITDFGLAKLQDMSGVTKTGVIAGTPAYMAPEQVTDFRNVGPPADIYALGVMAFEMHTGMLPFYHPESISLLLMHASDPPPRLLSRDPALPEELDDLISQCLEKNPARRPASSGSLGDRFEALRTRL